ncbi:MAG: hypothetical protein AB7R89_32405 [Dehalococcoidia bacterium]
MTTQQPDRSTHELPHSALPQVTAATLTLFRFYDVGYAIDLERAEALVTAGMGRHRTPGRVRQSSSIEIAQPPLWVGLGPAAVELAGLRLEGTLRASVYDLGAVTLALSLPLSGAMPWEGIADLFGATQEPPEPLEAHFRAGIDEIESLIRPAIERPERSALVEDYSVLMVERLAPEGRAAALGDDPLVRSALLGERRTLSADTYATVTRMSYEPAVDLALLSWNGALVVEPDAEAAATALDLLEFANVELLLLRSYDAGLEAEVFGLNDRITAARRRLYIPLVGRYNALLNDVQQLVIELTEVTERLDNAFKVTDDVYWNRLYSAALGVLRTGLWRSEVEHRLNLLRESYTMLHERADSDRSASLEWIIILLIAFEIGMAFLGIW